MFGPALALYGAAFAVSTPVGGMLMMTIALGLSSCTAVGHSMLQHDIAPAHAGVLFAVGNMVATVPGIVGVLSSGWLLRAFEGDWAAPLSLSATFYVIGGVVWLVCARTTPVV
eukprot:TRINITY_DN4960_c0_g1_i2.p2 TRINITY_DN4960_c0_g1~~TRINITY_DN4960_c0_g1_i2.p2  ORF type:complete len:113 (-),score=22.32 TRINITY_DN4960_c0_g1_i2:31-369(-)